MRALAEAENVRRRSKVEVDNQRQFAIQKFAQSLLHVCISYCAIHGDFERADV